jgi:multicomponent Na+:H+ antiporter subunit E
VAWLARGLALATFWLLLTGGDPGGLAPGVVVVTAAAWLAGRLSPSGTRRSAGRRRASGLARFVPYFLWHSLRGGADVAWRALHPRLPLAPRFETYGIRLSEGTSRVFFVNVVSLLPGTLSAELEGAELRVHVIGGGGAPVAHRLGALEERVAHVFGEPPPTREGGAGA